MDYFIQGFTQNNAFEIHPNDEFAWSFVVCLSDFPLMGMLAVDSFWWFTNQAPVSILIQVFWCSFLLERPWGVGALSQRRCLCHLVLIRIPFDQMISVITAEFLLWPRSGWICPGNKRQTWPGATRRQREDQLAWSTRAWGEEAAGCLWLWSLTMR